MRSEIIRRDDIELSGAYFLELESCSMIWNFRLLSGVFLLFLFVRSTDLPLDSLTSMPSPVMMT